MPLYVLSVVLNLADNASAGLKSAGATLQGIGGKMSTGVTMPILAAAGASIKLGTDLNAGMANVASLMPGNTARVNELKSAVQDVAIETGKGTSDMSDGLYQVVSAFGDSADTANILRTNALAAKAGLAETTDAIDLTSAVTKGYGDTSAAAVGNTADLALKTVQLGQTTFPELASSIGRVVPLAASLGVTQGALFGVMATGTGVTGTAAEVSTQLRGVLQSMMAPTAATTDLMASMGYESGQAMIEGEGLQGALQAIVGQANATGEPLQNYISSIEGQTLAMALAGPQSESLKTKIAAMGNAAGTTQAAFNEQTAGVNKAGFAMEQTKTQAMVLGQNFGTVLMPLVVSLMTSVNNFLPVLQGLIEKFTALDPKTQSIILGVIGLAAAVGPVLTVVGGLVSGVGAVIPVVTGAVAGLGGMSAILAALTGPVGWVIAAVALLATAWVTDFGGIQEKTRAVGQTISDWWTLTLKPAFEDVKSWCELYLVPLFTAVGGVVGAVATYFGDIATAVVVKLTPGFESLKTKLDLALTPLKDLRDNVLGSIKTAFEGISTAIELVTGFVDSLAEKIGVLQIPDWLKPGSPTPFETGLVGIARAMRMVSRTELPRLASGLQIDEPTWFDAGLAFADSGGGSAASARRSPVYVSGDTYNIGINDQSSAALTMAIVQDRRSSRLSAFMGA